MEHEEKEEKERIIDNLNGTCTCKKQTQMVQKLQRENSATINVHCIRTLWIGLNCLKMSKQLQ